MDGMDHRIRQVATVCAVALLLGGAAVAAVTATGQSSHSHHQPRRHLVVGARDLAAAASYLGVSTATLAAELRSGRTLVQIANATSAHSSAGLIAALEAD